MKNKDTSKSKRKLLFYIILLPLGTLIISTIFYWYEWRPRAIEKECSEQALEKSNRKKASYDTYFTICIREKML